MSGPLEHSPADVLRRLLIRLGHGTDPTDSGSWPMTVGIFPDTPDSAIFLTDTTGVSEGRHQPGGELQEKYGIQITVRHAEHDLCFRKAQQIAIALDQNVLLDTITIEDVTGTGSTTYTIYMADRRSGPLSLGQEKSGSKRHLFTVNALVKLGQSS